MIIECIFNYCVCRKYCVCSLCLLYSITIIYSPSTVHDRSSQQFCDRGALCQGGVPASAPLGWWSQTHSVLGVCTMHLLSLSLQFPSTSARAPAPNRGPEPYPALLRHLGSALRGFEVRQSLSKHTDTCFVSCRCQTRRWLRRTIIAMFW